MRKASSTCLHGNIDFDYLCESTLPDLCPEGGAPLRVGEMAYDVVIVPECETLRSTTLARLEAFAAAGGKLVFMGDAPKYEDAKPSARGKALFDSARQIAFSRGALLDALYDTIVPAFQAVVPPSVLIMADLMCHKCLRADSFCDHM